MSASARWSAIDPFHLAFAQCNLVAVGAVELNAVAALVLRHVARGVGGGQHARQRFRAAGHIDHTDADADLERSLPPDEVEIADGLAQPVGDDHRRGEIAVLEQNAELVATEAREGVAFAQAGAQQRSYLAQ